MSEQNCTGYNIQEIILRINIKSDIIMYYLDEYTIIGRKT